MPIPHTHLRKSIGSNKTPALTVWVYKLEGSTAIKTVTKKRVPVYCEDVRVVKFKMKEIVPAADIGPSPRRIDWACYM